MATRRITHTVVEGDTLSGIALKYRDEYDTTVSSIAELNKDSITDIDVIRVGQVITIAIVETSVAPAQNTVAIYEYGIVKGTDREVYIAWGWTKDNTAGYEVKWMYGTGNGVGFLGEKKTVEGIQNDRYSAPQNANHVACYIRPISETKKNKNGTETKYWTAQWSSVVRYYFKDNPPTTPPTPSVKIEDFTLTAELNNIGNLNADTIQFEVLMDDSTVFTFGKTKIVYDHTKYSTAVEPGYDYKVRCRAIRDDLVSGWSEWTDNVSTKPKAPASIIELRALSSTSVYISWNKVNTAKSYNIEYAEKKSRFDSSTEVQSMSINAPISHAEIGGLESGTRYYFRVRAVNEQGESEWTPIEDVVLGKKPAPPTTWSSTSTVTVGEPVIFYWIHNAEDGSKLRESRLMVEIGRNVQTYLITKEESDDEDESVSNTETYVFDTYGYADGTNIKWCVSTLGILDTWSDYSIMRQVNIYKPPVIRISASDASLEYNGFLREFPLNITVSADNSVNQKVIGYHISIVSNETYESTDNVGGQKIVKAGEEVYSKYLDTNENVVKVSVSPENISLENNITYIVKCVASFDSGLTAEEVYYFATQFKAYTDFAPNAEIGYNADRCRTYIRPYCVDGFDVLVDEIKLSVYRREYDGSFTEIASNLDNSDGTFVTDPHPALDYARYRIVATHTRTGVMSYYDVPGYPTNEHSVVIQWDEEWSTFDVDTENDFSQPEMGGSMLKLPYNINVSDSNSSDVELVEYIGRKHPVSYYGTQLGETATWNVEIDKKDKETLYALRRLSAWQGDVYVREPSGSGYHANVTVSFSQKHTDLTIPVTLNIVRVEGGV